MMTVLGVFIGGVIGLAILFLVVYPILERYSDQIMNFYDKYLEKWRKK